MDPTHVVVLTDGQRLTLPRAVPSGLVIDWEHRLDQEPPVEELRS